MMAERVLEFSDALAEVLSHARLLGCVVGQETLPLLESAGRVLARPVVAERDQPPFDRSTRDGFALRAAEAGEALRVVGSVRAGERWSGAALHSGEALEIMTGAPMPGGADAVVMVEHATLTEKTLQIDAGRSLRLGENVVPRGTEARVGETLLPVGRVLGAAEIAVAASCGCAALEVFLQPKVAIVATGDELVELGARGSLRPTHDDTTVVNGPPLVVGLPLAPARDALGDSQIYNSNSYALAALVRSEGGVAARLAIARDSFAELTERVQRGMAGDLLLLSGGVSMGKYDLVEQVLAELGAEFLFTGARIQPGKPVVFGRLPTFEPQRPWVYFFGLPGNPVSTQVCFHLFVAPLLRAMGGRSSVAPQFVEARLAEDVKGGAKVMRFLPAELSGAWDGVTVRVVDWQGSGDVAANARGNAYCVLPAGVERFSVGETVRVLLRPGL
jgi:molybdopterin molybdotransferase